MLSIRSQAGRQTICKSGMGYIVEQMTEGICRGQIPDINKNINYYVVRRLAKVNQLGWTKQSTWGITVSKETIP